MTFQLDKFLNTQSIKGDFSSAFKGLKIEFFKHKHLDLEGSPKLDMITESIPLSAINPDLKPLAIEINEEHSVEYVETLFENHGLHVQIFRLMANNWIETTKTDHYSLRKQMDLSRESLGLKN